MQIHIGGGTKKPKIFSSICQGFRHYMAQQWFIWCCTTDVLVTF